MDFQRRFEARFPFQVETGLAYNQTIFDKHQHRRGWNWMGGDGTATTDDIVAASVRLGRFAEPVPVTQNIPGWILREPVC